MSGPVALRPVVVGRGVHHAHDEGARGVVVGTFRHGCYIQVESNVYAVTGPSVMPGPIHLIVDQPPPRTREGLEVWRDAGRLWSRAWQLDLRDAPVYTPLSHGPATLRHATANLRSMRDRLAVPSDLSSGWEAIRRAVAGHDLVEIRSLLQGRGGGLTPTGDDVLAGVLLVEAWLGADRSLLVQLAETAATTTLSRSFLAWAARGQSLAPVHALVASAALDDHAGFDRAVRAVSAIGSSSGTALLWGVGLAATLREGAAVAPTGRSWS